MNKKGIILEVIIVLILLIVGFFWFVSNYNSNKSSNLKCIPVGCCHASQCAWAKELPDCGGIACTMSCEPGTMDCGQGYCEVIDGECEVVWNE